MSENSPKAAGVSPARTAKDKAMSAVVEARGLIVEIAGPMRAGTQIQEMLSAVGRRTGLGSRRLRGIWNNEARSIRAEELDALRQAAVCRREERERYEVTAFAARLAVLEDRVAQMDPLFARSLAREGCETKRVPGRDPSTLAGER